MDSTFAVVGTIVFTSKIFYWVAGLGYVATSLFCIVAAYGLPETTDFGSILTGCQEYAPVLKTLAQWIMFSNIVALGSAVSFFHFAKGGTVSVIGSILWMLNFL